MVRLWEQPADLFLQYPGLLPFAALGQSESPAEMLRVEAVASGTGLSIEEVQQLQQQMNAVPQS